MVGLWRCTGLESVVIGDGVELIGQYAFEDCTSLTDVTFGEMVKEIDDDAFSGCTGLETIEIDAETQKLLTPPPRLTE